MPTGIKLLSGLVKAMMEILRKEKLRLNDKIRALDHLGEYRGYFGLVTTHTEK